MVIGKNNLLHNNIFVTWNKLLDALNCKPSILSYGSILTIRMTTISTQLC